MFFLTKTEAQKYINEQKEIPTLKSNHTITKTLIFTFEEKDFCLKAYTVNLQWV